MRRPAAPGDFAQILDVPGFFSGTTRSVVGQPLSILSNSARNSPAL